MRQCIFCKKSKHESEFNREHIIPEGLGGKGADGMYDCVCTSCNSSLGTRVDAVFLNHFITKYQRNKYRIKGKNGIPNPYSEIEIPYADTFIKGYLKTDKNGEICGFRAKSAVYEIDGITYFAGPKSDRKNNAEKRAMSYAQKKGCSKPIPYDIGEPKFPSLKSTPDFEGLEDDYLMHAFPAMLKMAYEFCAKFLGEKYLDDVCADRIRQYLLVFRKDNIPCNPTEAKLVWGNDLDNKITLKIYKTDDNKLWVKLVILGYGIGTICMSEDASKYGRIERDELTITV